MYFEMRDFRTVVTEDIAYTSFVTDRPKMAYDGVDMILLKRVDDEWLVDRFVHFQMVNDTDPFRVPGGQKETWEGKEEQEQRMREREAAQQQE